MSESDITLSNSPDMVEHLDAGEASSEEGSPTRDDLIRLFVGPYASKYEGVLQAAKIKKNGMTWGWCWTAFVIPQVWLLYRKLYIEAVVLIILPIVIVLLLPTLDNAAMGLGACVAMFGKGYYLTRAQKKIDKIMALDEPGNIKLELIQKAGGVSWAAGIIGFAIFASIIGLVIMQASQPV